MNFSRVLSEAPPLLLQGMKVTILISVASIILGMILGFVVCMLGSSRSKILRAITGVYVWIIRGTPMLVQACLIFFGLPQLIQTFSPDFRITQEIAGLITLTLNAGAYMSEIFRGAIGAVPKGQVEAARSLGMSSLRTTMKIVLPQAFKIAVPSLVNQFIITVKDTSILSAIGLSEVLNKAKVYVGKTYQFFASYLLVAIFYLVFISILMVISKYLEKKINYDRKS